MVHRNIDRCNMCGICNASCPVYKVMRNEAVSPRNKVRLARDKKASELFYLCTDCRQCFKDCPVNVELDIESVREVLVREGKETGPNKRMRQNIKEFGNPFGDVKKIKNIKQFYT
ncbi:4Fe-4S dicluster domain-containing protein [Candidatus Woesearchaeota archaeon]|nr:4Fe-4S dicluster domain-containing protein [Candidatus Woesearchaeota archaeon]